MGIVDEIKQSYKQGGALTKLIYINIGVFVIIRLLQALFSLSTGTLDYPLLQWVSVPSDPMELLFKPWTIVTYMFVHYDFFHILFNMLWLYWFGKIFLEFLNPRQLLGVYFLGGITGAVIYLLAYNLVPGLYQFQSNSILLGASASVMAILFTMAKLRGDHKIYLMFIGGVKLKYLAIGSLVLDLINISALSNTGGHLAHIGGALFGYLYAGSLVQGKDVTIRFNRFMDKLATIFSRKSKMTVTHRRPITDMEYNRKKVNKQHEVDRILEKIKSSGYDSLTSDEKKTLFDASKK
nr:rhomboid family intramembrane serine protease [uncultured Carboxylicivirga sp.]